MPFLARVMQHPQFQAGDVDTKWLEREVERIKAELARPDAHVAPGTAGLVRDHA
jgi:acetyl/propionyl-CoA carboxylase alpha subunit